MTLFKWLVQIIVDLFTYVIVVAFDNSGYGLFVSIDLNHG